ncbi:MAG TPA: class I SAM-dependent methyltransferase, partial [Gaiellaceae bacterium]|nr:class I SAM-dependent methyltransferase [Gaiellaceae bacterium]
MTDVLAEQKAYYTARAREYDDWWFRRGRYELDPGRRARWAADVAEAEAALAAFRPEGSVVEFAAGTGLWTRHLARTASRLVAVDASAE